MSLKIIGSGFGRTGTMSMKEALGALGLGPCHHMTEIMENPAQLAHWKAIFAGETVDWNSVYAGYVSQVDWPGASVWRDAAAAFPDAKVIHTERPEDDWWASFNATIGKFFALGDRLEAPPHIKEIFAVMKGGFLKSTFDDFTDRESAIAAYRLNNRMVREVIPSDRLLIVNVAEGWEPLCRFLDAPTPTTPFPRRHPKKEFWEHFGGEPEAVSA